MVLIPSLEFSPGMALRGPGENEVVRRFCIFRNSGRDSCSGRMAMPTEAPHAGGSARTRHARQKLGICQHRGPREDLFSSAHEVDRRSWPTTSLRIPCGHGVARTWSTDEPIERDPLNGFQGCRTRRLTPATLPAHPVIRSDLIRSAPRLAGHLHTLEGGGGGGHTPLTVTSHPPPGKRRAGGRAKPERST